MILPLLLLAAAPAAAAAADPSPALSGLYACRGTADSAARLACFDRQVAALADAEGRRDVVVMDRAGMRKTRRSLFGLTIPNLNLFGNDKDDKEVRAEDSRLEAKIARAAQGPYGRWTFILDDGARWVQTDDHPLSAKVGDTIRIRRAALGSYLANVNAQTAVRVQRENR